MQVAMGVKRGVVPKGARPGAALPNPTESARAASLGDPEAQRQVFRFLKGSVHATLYRVLGSSGNLEDLVQESLIEIFRSLASYRGEARLTTWADRISVRVAYRHLRRRELVLCDAEWGTEASETPERQAGVREDLRLLSLVMHQLKPVHRIAFELVALDGYSLAEVASATGVSVIAVQSRVWRARRQLQRAAREEPVLSSHV